MRKSARLVVKGIRYYDGPKLLAAGALPVGTRLELIAEPQNPHDPNAVSIEVRGSGAQLGHIPRELAPKYGALLNAGRIVDVQVAAIEGRGRPRIEILVQYEDSTSSARGSARSLLGSTGAALPCVAGCYSIEHINTGRIYYGSSANMADRAREHIRALASKTHHNRMLQADYDMAGPAGFRFATVAQTHSPVAAAAYEARAIAAALRDGLPLYNMTEDGAATSVRRDPPSQGAAPVGERGKALPTQAPLPRSSSPSGRPERPPSESEPDYFWWLVGGIILLALLSN